MKALVIGLLIYLASILSVRAQQDAQYTFYMFNPLSINPAYAGTKDIKSFMAIYRHQWAGYDGAPRTASLGFHSSFKEKNGAGFYLENDRIGVHNRLTVMLNYAYRIPLGPGKLSMGLQGGLFHQYSDLNSVSTEQPDMSFADDVRTLMPNFGAGLYYYTHRWFLSLSVPHLLNTKLETGEDDSFRQRHYFLTGGVAIALSNNVIFKPTFVVKSVPQYAPFSTDISLNFLIKNRLWLGAAYRWDDSIDFLAQWNVNKNLKLGYAYDHTLTEVNKISSGSHEVMVGYDFGFDKSRVVTPRYF